MKYFLLYATALFYFKLSAQDTSQMQQKWLAQTASLLLTTKELSNDTKTPLASMLLKNKRIVLLGEASHGIADFYSTKLEIISYLHRTQDFDVLLFEGGLADIGVANTEVGGLSTEQLVNEAVYEQWRCKEMYQLFDSIKAFQQTNRPLQIGGFDVLYSSECYKNKILELTSVYNKTLNRKIIKQFGKLNEVHYQWDNTCHENYELCIAIKSFLDDYENQMIKESKVNVWVSTILKRAANTYIQYWNKEVWLNFDNLQYAVRDYLMGENIKWVADSLYPKKKIIIWGHNSHLGTQIPPFSLGGVKLTAGDVIRKRFKDSCYSIGIFANNGQAWNYRTKKIETFNSLLPFGGFKQKALFLNLSSVTRNKVNDWLFKPMTFYQTESGGTMTVTNSFDAVLFVSDVKASQPL